MTSTESRTRGIALNVTRTRVTVLVFNLTIISLMISQVGGGAAALRSSVMVYQTIHVALFAGFCLTLLGLFRLLHSQDLDAEGLSRPWSFTLGSVTTYLALSQTVTAFMHHALLAFESAVEGSDTALAGSTQALLRVDVLGNTTLLVLVVMGGIVWAGITYAGPLSAGIRSPISGGRGWVLAGYFLVLQVPIYWVYARAWHGQFVSADQPVSILRLFALQFVQPVLWLH